MLTTEQKLTLVDETVEFYTKNPRSIGKYQIGGIGPEVTGCVYLSKEGHKCAFSRLCTDEGVALLHEQYEGMGVYAIRDSEVMLKLGKDIKDIGFYTALQGLHDGNRNWNNKGISIDGLDTVDSMKTAINNGTI